MINYKFREDELIEEFKSYIDKTYSGHYNTGNIQSSEVIVDRGHGAGFFHGNIDKYNGRYGKKGESPDEWRKDIIKIIHYGFLALYEHDRVHSKETKDVDYSDTSAYTLDVTSLDFGGGMPSDIISFSGMDTGIGDITLTPSVEGAIDISMYNDDTMVYNTYLQTTNESNKDEK